MKNIRKLSLIICITLTTCCGIVAQQSQALIDADQLAQSGNYAKALDILEKSLVDFSSNKFQRAKAFYQMSYVYLRLDALDLAADYNQRSLDILNQIQYEYLADNYMRKGTIALRQNELEKALEYYFEARAWPAEDSQSAAILDGYIATTYAQLKNYPAAIKYQKGAIESLKISVGEVHPDVTAAYFNFANFYFQQGDFKNARKYYDLCKDRLSAIKSVDASNVNRQQANLLNAYGGLALQADENYSAAIDSYLDALAMYQQLYGTHHREVVRTKLNLAKAYALKEDFENAISFVQSAIESNCPKTRFNGELGNPTVDDLVLDKVLLLESLKEKTIILTHAYLSLGETEWLDSSLKTSLLAMKILDNYKNDYTDEATRQRLLSTNIDVADGGIAAAMIQFNTTKDQRFALQAFSLSEQSKARILSDLVQRQIAVKTVKVPLELLDKERQLKSEIATLSYQQLNKMLSQTAQEKLTAQQLELHQLQQSINALYPEIEELKNQQQVVQIDQIQAQLDDETVLIEYHLGASWFYIFGISNDDFMVKMIDRNAPVGVGNAMKFWKQAMKMPEENVPGTDVEIYSELSGEKSGYALEASVNELLISIKKVKKKEFAKNASTLYLKLIKPLRPLLKKKKKLIIVPHGQLVYLPFETLISTLSDGKEDYHKMNFLIRSYEISYHHSAMLFQQLQSPQVNKKEDLKFLGIAPVFSKGDHSSYIWDSNDFISDSTALDEEVMRSYTGNGVTFNELKYSENEVVNIAKYFAKKGKTSKAFLHQAANESAFKANLNNYDIVHIASHSFINKQHPKFSGIAFAQPAAEGKEDGILFASETFNLDFGGQLLVLSSCESGTGKIVNGDGIMSLSRGFIAAGAPNILCSLWKVYDEQTSTLMKHFYTYLLDEKSNAAALKKAKTKMIRKKATANPKFWSAFILIGK